MQKILITGGFGYIGSKLILHLKNKYKFIILEHPNATKPKFLKNVKVIRADITKSSQIKKLRIKNISVVLHLAAQSSGPKSFSIPVEDVKKNLIGTINTINLCKNNKIKRIIYASSFVVYGDSKKQKLDENLKCNPKSVYATTKYASELMLKNYAEPQGINWNILRMYNVYGLGQDLSNPQTLVGIFLKMINETKIIEVKGSLERFRDIIEISDVVSGWEKCIIKGKKNQIYNLGTGKKTTFRKLINTILKVLNKKNLKIVQKGKTMGDVKGSFADLKKIAKDLKFKPKLTLKEGIKQIYDQEILKIKK